MQVKDRLQIFEKYKAERTNWDVTWQTVAEYVNVRKADFTTEQEAGSFLNTNLFDNTAQLALNTRASTLLSLLWDGGKFSYIPNQEHFDDSTDENDWFEYATNISQKEFKKINSDSIFFESELDEGAFGSSYPYLDGDSKGGLNLFLFQVKEVYVGETKKNVVDIIYRQYCLTVLQAVNEFGFEGLPDKIKTKYNNNNLTDKVKILHIIQPRLNRDPGLKGKDNMKYESVYICLETKEELLKHGGVQSGFEYFPVFVSREAKKNGENYGRSPAMMAISDIAQLNKLREDQTIIFNRDADPAVGYDPTALQGNIIDTSPGSATAFRMTGRASIPIFDMIPTKGDVQATEVAIVRLQESINNFFGIDRLLDFNSDTQMTLGESQIRAQIRQQSLGAILIKKRAEKYEPIVKRAFDILFKQGKFGYMPNDPRLKILSDLGEEPKEIPESIVAKINSGIEPIDLIDVEFFTQFELEKKLLENNTILQVWQNAGLIAQLLDSRDVFDNLDYDKSIKALGRISMNVDIFRDQKEVINIRKMEEQKMALQQALAAGKEVSEIEKNIA
jgi:hypothetical protein